MDQTIGPLKMKEVHEADRPRERLIRQGAASLSNQELLAILLRTGTKDESVLALANRILKVFEKVQALQYATLQEMVAIKGVGEVKAVQILAAVELGKRLLQREVDERYCIRSPQDAASYLMPDMAKLQQEHFVVLFLNTKNEIIHKKTIFIGDLSTTIVHPREVYREAVKRTAASIIVAHNHPSGNPKPSDEDFEVTMRLFDAGRIVGIDLLDHLVIGDFRFVSLKEEGFFNKIKN